MSLSARERARLLGLDRLGIFVPAVMSVGLLFWIVSEATELVRNRGERVREQRARIAGAAVADEVVGHSSDEPRGLRQRPVYLMIGLTLVVTAAYVVIGSVANFVRPGGYVSDVAWLLALAAGVATVAVGYGATALVVFASWPTPPAWARGVLLRSPLGGPPDLDEDLAGRPSWRLGAAVVWTMAAAAALAFVVAWSPHLVHSFDRDVADWLQQHVLPGWLMVLDPVGSTGVAVAVALLGGLAALRCRVLAVAYAASLGLGLVIGSALRVLVSHPRPAGGPLAGHLDSFPSGHVLLIVLFVGLFPLALAVLFSRTWIVGPARVVLGIGAVAVAAHRVEIGAHWPSDVAGGALIGLALVLAVQWAVDDRQSHRACHSCPWSDGTGAVASHGVLHVHPSWRKVLRVGAHLATAVAASTLAYVTLRIDLPSQADGYGLGPSVARPVQLGLVALLSVAALVAWRWEGAGAVLVAIAAAGIGVFAAVEYPPLVGLLLTGALLVPAFLLWLSWQHSRRPHELTAVAVVSAVLLAVTWAGGMGVYDHFFGPTHPESTAPDLPIDSVDWVWAGGLDAQGITVTAQLVDDVHAARLEVEPVDGGPVARSDVEHPDEDHLVRFRVDGLAPDAEHRYRVIADGEPDHGRGHGWFRTPAVGPTSFTFTAAACARTGSNGAVFDSIRAEDPLLHLALGDLHYSNIESTSPSDFVAAYRGALMTPAQSALARAVPQAYVWDDHDYGPNDAGAEAPGRSAVRDAYRRAFPHYEVPEGDAPINQAFTIGRVRFVLTDTRSEHTQDTVLGEQQLAWLRDELRTSSPTHALVVWVNAIPWIGAADPASDAWAGVPEERALIADTIADAGIENLVMVSGDAHMVAYDDGTSSDYSTAGGGGFPILHAAALDRPGNVKGGPYSGGTFPGTGRYGVVDVEDDGGPTISVRLAGRTWDGETLLEHTLDFDVPPGAR
jgi:membrane-associated phospholipid phosphatase